MSAFTPSATSTDALDRLATMHRLIGEDIASRPIGSVTIIHLGDLIDRGPDSAGVVALMLEPWTTSPAPHVVNLMGNHEDMMLTALAVGDVGSVRHWMSNGGAETLHSWGISHRAPPETWWAEIPPVHLGFLRGLSLMHRAGGYAFVHAGVRPSVPLERQSAPRICYGSASRSCHATSPCSASSCMATRRSKSRSCVITGSASIRERC